MARSKDLFDDTTMTFGEHLEALRIHLFKAVLGLILALVVTLNWGNWFVDLIRKPIDKALTRNELFNQEEVTSFWGQVNSWFHKAPAADSGNGNKQWRAGKKVEAIRPISPQFSSTSSRRLSFASCMGRTRPTIRLHRLGTMKRPCRWPSPPASSVNSGRPRRKRTARSR